MPRAVIYSPCRDDIFCYETAAAEEAAVVTVAVYLRERKNSSTYSPSNLFGQPLLVSLPAECSQAELYRALLVRMGRYVAPPREGEEWWRPPAREAGEEMEVAGGTPETGSEGSPSTETPEAKAEGADADMESEEEEVGLHLHLH